MAIYIALMLPLMLMTPSVDAQEFCRADLLHQNTPSLRLIPVCFLRITSRCEIVWDRQCKGYYIKRAAVLAGLS